MTSRLMLRSVRDTHVQCVCVCVCVYVYVCNCTGLLLHLITLREAHTHSLGRTPLDERSARHRGRSLTAHTIHKRQTFVSPA
jgi:hypothetical protein